MTSTDRNPLTLTIDFGDGDTATATRITGKDDVPRLWEYKGKVYADNLFRLHDELGFPLAFSLGECEKNGWIPCLSQFTADAIRAGWSADRADRVISEARADA